MNHPEDDAAIKEAASTIGDYKLKTDLEYEPYEEELETTMTKYRDLLRVRKEMFTIRNDYNGEVFALRDDKKELMKYVEQKKRKLLEIHEEIPENQRKLVPVEVTINLSVEYPEKEFEMEDDLDGQNQMHNDQHKPLEVGSTAYVERMQKYILGLTPFPDGTPYTPLGTVWEKELRETRLMKKLFKQDRIIEKILKRIDDFDQRLTQLTERRMKVEVDAKYLEIYQLTLYQELWILKDFEKIERKMINTVEELTLERNNLQKSVIESKHDIEQSKQEMEQIRTEQKAIFQQFMSNCSDNSFSAFLKRIYKKKYKPCKINHDKDETESSSEYSSEDIDALENAVDTEVSKIFLDEQPCPLGCDPELYELTIKLRNEKIELEKRYYEENRALNETIKTMEGFKMKLAYLESRLTDKKRELLIFRVSGCEL